MLLHCIIKILTLASDVFFHDHCDCRWLKMRRRSACMGTVFLQYVFWDALLSFLSQGSAFCKRGSWSRSLSSSGHFSSGTLVSSYACTTCYNLGKGTWTFSAHPTLLLKKVQNLRHLIYLHFHMLWGDNLSPQQHFDELLGSFGPRLDFYLGLFLAGYDLYNTPTTSCFSGFVHSIKWLYWVALLYIN